MQTDPAKAELGALVNDAAGQQQEERLINLATPVFTDLKPGSPIKRSLTQALNRALPNLAVTEKADPVPSTQVVQAVKACTQRYLSATASNARALSNKAAALASRLAGGKQLPWSTVELPNAGQLHVDSLGALMLQGRSRMEPDLSDLLQDSLASFEHTAGDPEAAKVVVIPAKDAPSLTADHLHKAASKFATILQLAAEKGDLNTALEASLMVNQCQADARQLEDVARLVGEKETSKVVRELNKQGVPPDTMFQLLLSLSNSPAAREALNKAAAIHTAPLAGHNHTSQASTSRAGEPQAEPKLLTAIAELTDAVKAISNKQGGGSFYKGKGRASHHQNSTGAPSTSKPQN